MKARVAILLTLALGACAVMPPPDSLAGSWGGRGIALRLDGAGGRLEYDCAAGTIDGPLSTDAAGAFVASGTHTPGLGGPERIDQPRPSFPARYSGIVRGDAMRLSVDIPARDLHLGPFALRRGAEPTLLRCL